MECHHHRYGRRPRYVTFCANVTEALNFVLRGFLRPGMKVVVFSMEHNAVMRPLRAWSPFWPWVSRTVSSPQAGIARSGPVSVQTSGTSSLRPAPRRVGGAGQDQRYDNFRGGDSVRASPPRLFPSDRREIGRASCRERV